MGGYPVQWAQSYESGKPRSSLCRRPSCVGIQSVNFYDADLGKLENKDMAQDSLNVIAGLESQKVVFIRWMASQLRHAKTHQFCLSYLQDFKFSAIFNSSCSKVHATTCSSPIPVLAQNGMTLPRLVPNYLGWWTWQICVWINMLETSNAQHLLPITQHDSCRRMGFWKWTSACDTRRTPRLKTKADASFTMYSVPRFSECHRVPTKHVGKNRGGFAISVIF